MPKKTTKETTQPEPEKKKQKLKKSPEKIAFGDKLKFLRESKGLKQDKLAQELGMHVQSISRFERGLIDPVMSSLVTIAKYFGVSVDWLSNYSSTPYTDNNYLKISYIDNDGYWIVDRSFLKNLPDEINLKAFSVRNNDLHPAFQFGDVVLISVDKLPAVDKYVILLSGSEYIIKRVVSISQDGNTLQLTSNNGTPLLEVPVNAIVGVIESFSRGYL